MLTSLLAESAGRVICVLSGRLWPLDVRFLFGLVDLTLTVKAAKVYLW